MPTNYAVEARELLRERHPNLPDDLLDLYALLALTTTTACQNIDVHDAWVIWKSRTDPGHRSCIPYDDLAPNVQAMDTKYTEAINAVSAQIFGRGCQA